MNKMAALNLVPATPVEAPALQKIAPLGQVLASIRVKIREDLFRFRTCCADPRASK